MLDIMCLGFTERLYLLQGSVWHDKYEKLQIQQKWTNTVRWIERMRENPLFKNYVPKEKYYHKHLEKQDAQLPGVKIKFSLEYIDQE